MNELTENELTDAQKATIQKVKDWAAKNAAEWVLDNLADERISNSFALGLAKKLSF